MERPDGKRVTLQETTEEKGLGVCMGGLHCETDNARDPRSHKGVPIVGTDQGDFQLPRLRLNERIVYFHRQAALAIRKYCIASLLVKRH